MKLKNAAQITACCGGNTRVDTTVAIELAASCKPVEEVEQQRDRDQEDQNRKGESGIHVMALPYITCLSMISRANAFRVCREGKPVSTFPDHAQTCSITMELISLATSSKRSDTFSRCL